MVIKNKGNTVADKIESWMVWLTGIIFGLFVTIGTFFFKNFFGRLTIAELCIKEIETKTHDFRVETRDKMKDQQFQNTREHNQLARVIDTGLKSLGQSMDIERDARITVSNDIKEILTRLPKWILLQKNILVY